MNSLTIKTRSVARKVGLIRLINRLRSKRSYEDRFHAALREVIRSGDSVWDIGANVGFYSEIFLEWVGPSGSVVAFEPVPDTAAKIHERVPNDPRLRVECVGLGSETGEVEFLTGNYTEGSHLIRAGEHTGDDKWIVPVRIVTGDQMVTQLGHTPNVIKLDVEGFEEQVLLGLTNTLRDPQLRAVCVEVHFTELEKQGQANAPVRIEKLLRTSGFQVSWTDASHLKAERTK